MANYTQITDFSLKDAKPSGDPDKLIKGVDFDGEFTAISTAIQSKVNITNPQTTGLMEHTGTISFLNNQIELNGSAVKLGNGGASSVETYAPLLSFGTATFSEDVTFNNDVEFNDPVKFDDYVYDANVGDDFFLRFFNSEIGAGACGGIGYNHTSLSIGTSSGFLFTTDTVYPWNVNLASTREGINLGNTSSPFYSIALRISPIVTSDTKFKDNIRDLTEAEKRVAVKCKKLLRAYTLKFDPESKVQVGVVAQELQQAFQDESLDANNYSLFVSETDDSGETTLAVRYEQLLAFIIAAL
jgi:hypothetical protein